MTSERILDLKSRKIRIPNKIIPSSIPFLNTVSGNAMDSVEFIPWTDLAECLRAQKSEKQGKKQKKMFILTFG